MTRKKRAYNFNYPAPKGERFGMMVVIDFSHRDHYSKAYWRCQCDCGKKIVTRASNLRAGRTKSCGCIKPQREFVERDKGICEALDTGLTYAAVASRYGITRSTVSGVVSRQRKRDEKAGRR